MRIIPAILTSDPGELSSMLKRCEGEVDRVQIDIIDGVFANNKTIDPTTLESVETDVFLDFHLMVREPVNWVERCVRAGADRVIGQVEQMEDQIKFLEKVEGAGIRAGLGIDLKTQISSLDPTALNSTDCVLVMSVAAGFGGQEFDVSALDKIGKLSGVRERDNMSFSIIDDGGITLGTVDDAKRAGVDEVVVGKRLFDGDLQKNIERMIKASYARD